jgi:sugar (pentulose or hexulose) kinase
VALVVGVDMATATVRAVAADASGRVEAEAQADLPEPVSPAPGHSEQDASAWWPTVATVLSELTADLGPARESIAAVCVCATSGTVVALDREGEPLGPALMYDDQRAEDEAEKAQEAAADRWQALGLHVRATFGLPKLGWLMGQSEYASSCRRLAHASDAVVTRLVGGAAPTDWSHALKSGYDPLRQEWAAEAMAALGVPVELLPDVRRPSEAVGKVSEKAAEATGLPTGCEVRLGMTDACASQLAAGASSPGEFVSVLGSTLVLKGASEELVTDPAGVVYCHRHPDGWWLPGGASNTGAKALVEGFPDANLASLDEQAAEHGPAGCVVYPLLVRGERFPFAASDAEGFVLGEPADEVERYRATLEGVAFVERLGYDRLRELGAVPEPPIAVAGGGSRSRVWNRIRATVLEVPVLEKAGATTAAGACILAAAGTLHPDLATACQEMAAEGERVEPDEGERDTLEASYQRFVEAVGERGWLGKGT